VRQRHAEQLVNAAGLSLLGIAFLGLFGSFVLFADAPSGPPLPNFWEFVLLAGGLGLIAYAAADRIPGPAYLGVVNLLGFVGYASFSPDETLKWWPVLLLVTGGVLLVIGLRPRIPLPPPPESSTRPGDQPLAARTEPKDT
jgi:peptidoglycan/LPS O-acetylase OafA/YrhL